MKVVNWGGSSSTTRLFISGGAIVVEDFGGTGEEVTKYYLIAGMRVAMKDDLSTSYFAKTPAKRLFDHLSSASLVMDGSGGVITNQRFMPFGAPRVLKTILEDYTDDGYTDLGFTD